MTDAPAAISGTFSTYRHVPSRGCVQLVIEIPVEAQAAAFAALGYPEPGKSLHVAVARLNGAPTAIESSDAAHSAGNVSAEGVPPSHGVSEAKARYDGKTDMEKAAVRAALLCKDESFQKWLWPVRGSQFGYQESEAAAALRNDCQIDSRSEIATNYNAYLRFIALENRYRMAVGQLAEERG